MTRVRSQSRNRCLSLSLSLSVSLSRSRSRSLSRSRSQSLSQDRRLSPDGVGPVVACSRRAADGDLGDVSGGGHAGRLLGVAAAAGHADLLLQRPGAARHCRDAHRRCVRHGGDGGQIGDLLSYRYYVGLETLE